MIKFVKNHKSNFCKVSKIYNLENWLKAQNYNLYIN